MKHFDQSEVSMTYTSNTTGQTIDMSTTMVTIPDPHHRYDVTMGDRHLSFMACDVFDALERLLAGVMRNDRNRRASPHAGRAAQAGREGGRLMNDISDEMCKVADEYDVLPLYKLADRIDSEMVELPVDADGVPIHVGDVMEWPYGNGEFIVEGIGGNTLFYIDKDSNECEWTAAGDKRHHYTPPTVEDVLQEMLEQAVGYSDAHTTVALNAIAEYSAKLKLAGEGE